MRALVAPFADPEVGAVSGNTKVGNRRGLLGRWQHIEYVIGFNLDRRMFDVLRCMPTVPGAIGAFRRETLEAVGGVSDDTLAEDTDLTMATCRAGWRVVYAPDARAWTEAPATLGQLWRQRYRWCYGTMQAMWKHRGAVLEGGASGKLGRRGLPYLLAFQVLLPLLAPIIDIAARLLDPVPALRGDRNRLVGVPGPAVRQRGLRLPARPRTIRTAVEPAAATGRLPAADVPRGDPVGGECALRDPPALARHAAHRRHGCRPGQHRRPRGPTGERPRQMPTSSPAATNPSTPSGPGSARGASRRRFAAQRCWVEGRTS